ncbi:hypothetical protein QJS04_geneDACA022163 [Acorus gramineus]|uniref:Glycolipid transfer protein domain-containing protein n=1 Tax=Acorus gramineus TaxID=55184 RepID=A0AAV9BN62_ACOGR|nr:hypothetical protein QJS04_geneDACA022163 [Acorus gramineus]
MAGEGEKPLRRITEAFDSLAEELRSLQPSSSPQGLEVGPLSRACSHVSVLFGFLGFAFKFAESDYVSKVDDLMEASKSISKLPSLLDQDIEQDCVRRGGSHSRNLLRVKRGLDMVKVLFEQILISDRGNSLKDPASIAYSQVFAPHHSWAIRKAVAAGMYTLPTKAQLLKKLNEDEDSARIQMQAYIFSSGPVILYINELFLARGLGIDW